MGSGWRRRGSTAAPAAGAGARRARGARRSRRTPNARSCAQGGPRTEEPPTTLPLQRPVQAALAWLLLSGRGGCASFAPGMRGRGRQSRARSRRRGRGRRAGPRCGLSGARGARGRRERGAAACPRPPGAAAGRAAPMRGAAPARPGAAKAAQEFAPAGVARARRRRGARRFRVRGVPRLRGRGRGGGGLAGKPARPPQTRPRAEIVPKTLRAGATGRAHDAPTTHSISRHSYHLHTVSQARTSSRYDVPSETLSGTAPRRLQPRTPRDPLPETNLPLRCGHSRCCSRRRSSPRPRCPWPLARPSSVRTCRRAVPSTCPWARLLRPAASPPPPAAWASSTRRACCATARPRPPPTARAARAPAPPAWRARSPRRPAWRRSPVACATPTRNSRA
jgi:hypothetical protein